MSKVKYDVVAIVGEKTDAQGNKKPRYMKCGIVAETSKGLRMKLDAIPVGADGWFGLFEPDNRQNTSGGGTNDPV